MLPQFHSAFQAALMSRLPSLSLALPTSPAGPSKHCHMTAYRKRLREKLDGMHGPGSLDDFIYGYGDEVRIESNMSESRPFHTGHFYLNVVHRLADCGF
jgi:hypothetical protein